MSSLAVGFSITQNAGCQSLTFTDTSGWGTGSSGSAPSYDQVGSTKIEFYLSNGTVKTFTNFLPTAQDNDIVYYANDLGYTDVIPDQEVENVIYTIYDTDGNVLGTHQMPVLFSCNFISCFYGQVQKIVNTPACNVADLDRLSNMYLRYLGIQSAFEDNAGCMLGAIEELSEECSKLCMNNCGGNCN